jgi:hypothetical protein
MKVFGIVSVMVGGDTTMDTLWSVGTPTMDTLWSVMVGGDTNHGHQPWTPTMGQSTFYRFNPVQAGIVIGMGTMNPGFLFLFFHTRFFSFQGIAS